MNLTLRALIAQGESKTLELKRSTGELREAMQTLCAFANGKGGRVLIGVKPSGDVVGQQVSEQTLHEIAAARGRFEPPLWSIWRPRTRDVGRRKSFVLTGHGWTGLVADLLGPWRPEEVSEVGAVPEREPRHLGPFALAYLEALIRIADWRASDPTNATNVRKPSDWASPGLAVTAEAKP